MYCNKTRKRVTYVSMVTAALPQGGMELIVIKRDRLARIMNRGARPDRIRSKIIP